MDLGTVRPRFRLYAAGVVLWYLAKRGELNTKTTCNIIIIPILCT